MDKIEVLPKDLDEAIDLLKTFLKDSLPDIKKMSERKFLSSSHFSGGMFIRNAWQLWWVKNHGYKEWNPIQPPLNAWFESIDIVHADDMSAIILTCFHRNLKGKDYAIEKQVKHYKKHWKEQGYPDGIPKRS